VMVTNTIKLVSCSVIFLTLPVGKFLSLRNLSEKTARSWQPLTELTVQSVQSNWQHREWTKDVYMQRERLSQAYTTRWQDIRGHVNISYPPAVPSMDKKGTNYQLLFIYEEKKFFLKWLILTIPDC